MCAPESLRMCPIRSEGSLCEIGTQVTPLLRMPMSAEHPLGSWSVRSATRVPAPAWRSLSLSATPFACASSCR